jgi:hypothetical protein
VSALRTISGFYVEPTGLRSPLFGVPAPGAVYTTLGRLEERKRNATFARGTAAHASKRGGPSVITRSPVLETWFSITASAEVQLNDALFS